MDEPGIAARRNGFRLLLTTFAVAIDDLGDAGGSTHVPSAGEDPLVEHA